MTLEVGWDCTTAAATTTFLRPANGMDDGGFMGWMDKATISWKRKPYFNGAQVVWRSLHWVGVAWVVLIADVVVCVLLSSGRNRGGRSRLACSSFCLLY